MKYKLINRQTGEETFCDKVTIDGYDYYVSDEIQLGANNVWVATKSRVFKFKIHMAVVKSNMPRIVIATNNPNIDIPKVVDEVERLKFVYNEGGNKDVFTNGVLTGIEIGYNKSQETHPFSEDDMIEFAKWCSLEGWKCIDYADYLWDKEHQANWKTTKELLQLWKEQRIKTLYYE